MDEWSARKLLNLMQTTKYDIIQTNGQRIYGPPPDWPHNQIPPKNCEVFVGRLPRDCFEDELVPVFSQIGPIYKLRLMIDFSGHNRGYAFVTYTNASDARNAVQMLDKYLIRPNSRIGVTESVDNCRLFIGNLPLNLTQKQVFDEFNKLTEGVVSVVLYYNTNKRIRSGVDSNGFAFVEYETHRDAAMARRKLLPEENSKLFGTQISIDWAIPESKGDKKIMSEVTVLFVRYLNYEASEEMIKSFFTFNNESDIIRVKRIKNYAFVHFKDRKTAELAFSRISAMDLRNCILSEYGGQPLEVKWSIPPNQRHTLISPFDVKNTSNKALNPMAIPFHPTSPTYSMRGRQQLDHFKEWSILSSTAVNTCLSQKLRNSYFG